MCCAVLCFVAQSCPTLCDPMDCSPPDPSLHGASSGKNTGVGCHAILQGIFPTQGSNPGLLRCRPILYCLSHQGSPFPMHIQGWFPVGLTGWISLLSKGSQESSLAPQFKSISSLAFSLLHGPALTPIHDYWKNHSFDYLDLCQQRDVSAF